MRQLTGGDWASSCPATNCLWVAYLAEVLAAHKIGGGGAAAAAASSGKAKGKGRAAGVGGGGAAANVAGVKRKLREFR